VADSGGRRVLVVGGGISGLAAAWFLHRREVDVCLVEAAARVGGTIGSERRDGFLVELGPNTTLQKPGRPEDALGRLVDQAGLAPRLREAAPAGKRRFILRNGRLLALPGSPAAFLVTPAFSLLAKLRLLGEPFIRRGDTEETIARFVRRRLGREFLDYAVDPFISGVYAGNPQDLSIEAAVPRIFELEQQYGSLIRGAIALGKATRNTGMPAGRQISFEGGMATLPQALADALPDGMVRVGRRAVSLERGGGAWQVHLEDDATGHHETERADVVVLALPAPATAALVEPLANEAARLLRGIPYAAILSVALGYPRAAVAHALDGFGFLAPRVEGLRTLGALFSSTLFPDRAPPDHVLLTAFIGGTQDPQAIDMPDNEAFTAIDVDLSLALGIRRSPVFRHLTRWRQAIPQYTVGHLDRVDTIDEFVAPLPGLHLHGNWRGGISLADCVRNGEALAERIAGPR
jgi:oxygen-dependent protoporphyrinogen oxidase